MRGWWQEITGLVLPVACAGCGCPRTALCDTCARALHGRPAERVRPAPVPPGLPEVRAAAPYGDAVRAVLLAHKERGALALAAPLGVALAGAVHAAVRAAAEAAVRGATDAAVRAPAQGPGAQDATGAAGSLGEQDGTGVAGCPQAQGGVVGAVGAGLGLGRPYGGLGAGGGGAGPLLLVPVPSVRRVVRARGHDAVRRVAVAAAGELRRSGLAARVLPVLRQRRAVADQAGLDARQRRANLAGALEVVPGAGRLLWGGPVVLVDDLMTTGATLAEAARAVRSAAVGAPEADGAELGTSESRRGAVGVCGGVSAACGALPGTCRAVGGGGASSGVCGSTSLVGGALSGARGPAGVSGAAASGACGPAGAAGGGVLDGWGTLLVGAAVVAASPKAFEINRN